MNIEKNLHHIVDTIEKTKQENELSYDITIVAATKTQPFSLIEKIYSLGINNIGENRIQEAVSKFGTFKDMPNIVRRFIGHLQSNKVNKFLEMFDTIDSIDSSKLANKINNKAATLKKSIPALLEINTSGDKNKKGFSPKLSDDIIHCMNLDHINVNGLMTLGPFSRDEDETRQAFVDLRKFSDTLNKEHGGEKLTNLSMGMSGDYVIGIQEGSTMVRVGTSLFWPKKMKLYYFCSKKVFEQFELEPNKQEHQHGSVIIDGNAFIYPHTTTEQSINPLNLNSIKLSLSIEKVILVDRIFGQEEMTKTKDHINRTGVSFLRGNTPFKELPTFPDVSNIYRTEKGKVFMSIGDKNPLKIIPGKDVILSEWMAPISTVWHYLGVNVFGIGVNNNTCSLDVLVK